MSDLRNSRSESPFLKRLRGTGDPRSDHAKRTSEGVVGASTRKQSSEMPAARTLGNSVQKALAGLGAGFLGAWLGTREVFPRLFDLRYPDAGITQVVPAQLRCQSNAAIFFAIAFAGGFLVCGLAQNRRISVPIGFVGGLAGGAILGILSTLVYFLWEYGV